MNYSLLSKFQGALLGAVLGSYVGFYFENQIEKNRENYRLSINKDKLHLSNYEKKQLQKWVEIIVNSSESLIRKQEFNQDDWQKVYKEWQDKWNQKKDYTNAPNTTIKSSPKELEKLVSIVNNKQPSLNYINNDDIFNPTASNAIISSLPVSLLYHDNKLKLQQKLEEWGKVWKNYLEVNLSNLVVGYIITQILTERLEPLNIIPKIIDYIGEKEPLVGQLRQVDKLINEGANLDAAINHFSEDVKYIEKQQILWQGQQKSLSSTFFTPISLALYCFLSTPEDFSLAVLRSARTGWTTQTCTIVGTLSGAYNSIFGVPVEWRQKMGVELLSMKDEIEIMKLAKNLWAVWCGVYDPNITPSIMPTVVASNVISPRPHSASSS
ncbi:ADP-ribosylglycohydrolase family protein [Okeania sp.]|uniref:ADP-ribosylglycohydrolase family protein n=1 Tax=Okeania sp. TaxID=3100323 RepID=UPI002B4B91D9|nr:ADP-ribosylglycohydrolase family protein [Okeania sp.]MEB3341620.1 ADP-ribosylglycohydrolase family protein [Okeania sp.]